MKRLALLLISVLAALWALSVALQPHIAGERQAAAERLLLRPLAGVNYDNQPLQEPQRVGPPLSGAWQARQGAAPVAQLLRITGQGYEGPFSLLLARDPAGHLLGLALLEQRETPGLAALDEAPRQAWLQRLRGYRAEQLRLRQDGGEVDAIAGATRTSRAVLDTLRAALTTETGR